MPSTATERHARPDSTLPRHRVLLLAVAVVVVATFFLPRIAQDQEYHDFADKRPILGIPNGLDVLSNVPFVLVGAWGVLVAWRSQRCGPPALLHPWDVWPYSALFVGTLLTGFGSGWYHLRPDDARLVWDRLPMTVGFMGLLTAVLSERVSAGLARRIFVPLLLFGAGSVFWWGWTESQGRGDLRPYVLVQFGSMLVMVLTLVLYPARRGGTGWLVAALGVYVLAKVAEALDDQILALGGVVSGHSLKHLFAALAVALVACMLRSRTEVVSGRGDRRLDPLDRQGSKNEPPDPRSRRNAAPGSGG